MMLYPSIMDLMKKAESRYSLVIAASKRAREICEETEKEGNGLDGAKSITKAVGEIYQGDIEIVEGHDIEPDKRAILESTISEKFEGLLAGGSDEEDEYDEDRDSDEDEDEDEDGEDSLYDDEDEE